MSPEITSQPSGRRWILEHPLFIGLLFSVVMPFLIGASSVWYAQGQTAKELDALKVKQVMTDAQIETNKREGGEQLKELRKEVVTKDVLDEKWKTVDKIDRTVERLLELQLKAHR
jgi:hypothetical protein